MLFKSGQYDVQIEKGGRWATVAWARGITAARAKEVIADLAARGEHARMVRL